MIEWILHIPTLMIIHLFLALIMTGSIAILVSISIQFKEEKEFGFHLTVGIFCWTAAFLFLIGYAQIYTYFQ